ncbi:PocR ligand-binding domain-containing protein [Paenibacillus sp. NFR01]|uniref:PocR ligand-binding domain-containing protein n=1 Tax=Paenibacillus sp. NFR01 TaxID=1566279 RepID=UPI0008AB8C79|nr:PocR ligand-binding domain-containing protein [Paenibacillus sp. NFR01]SEU23602.1 Ligand-binding sensor domain-containing protein [Paenibacillus sp. NFR01]
MSNPLFHLENIIDLEKWHTLQDSLALVTKMAIITVNYKGVPVSKHSYCQPFCQGVRKDDALSPYCQKCDARGGLEAVRLNKPYIYKCHFNIIDIAIPIIIDNQYIGAVMAGQIKLKDSDEQLEQLVSRPPSAETEDKFKALETDYRSLPTLTYEEVATTADMLFHLCNYIVGEAITKNATIQMYKKTLTADNASSSADFAPAMEQGFGKLQAMQSELSHTLVEHSVRGLAAQPIRPSNPLLQPAFDYFYRHKSRNITLEEMAKQCHISPSYFSRIFAKETGERFSVFAPRLKVEWAKQMLETTDQPVHQISDALGFCDAGYFIKTFKRFVHLTPAVYRIRYRGQR